MDMKEFIFPGVILGIVVIVAAGLLITHPSNATLIPNAGITADAASSTDAIATSTAPSSLQSVTAAAVTQRPPKAYYPFGTVTLSLGQAAGFKDGVSLRPLAVTEDSRCPMGVMCIQAGTVKVSLKVDAGGKDSIETIELGGSLKVGNDTISLGSVSPARAKDAAPTQGSYRLTFKVTP